MERLLKGTISNAMKAKTSPNLTSLDEAKCAVRQQDRGTIHIDCAFFGSQTHRENLNLLKLKPPQSIMQKNPIKQGFLEHQV